MEERIDRAESLGPRFDGGLSDHGAVGQRATITGIARNAKLGAVIVTADSTPVYLTGKADWCERHLGQPVRAIGTLRRRKLAPDPLFGCAGEINPGIEGESYVLDDAEWTLVAMGQTANQADPAGSPSNT